MIHVAPLSSSLKFIVPPLRNAGVRLIRLPDSHHQPLHPVSVFVARLSWLSNPPWCAWVRGVAGVVKCRLRCPAPSAAPLPRSVEQVSHCVLLVKIGWERQDSNLQPGRFLRFLERHTYGRIDHQADTIPPLPQLKDQCKRAAPQSTTTAAQSRGPIFSSTSTSPLTAMPLPSSDLSALR